MQIKTTTQGAAAEGRDCALCADLRWVPAGLLDLPEINRIANQVHTTLPERDEVFGEKLRLFPEGCLKLMRANEFLGYGISHLWTLGIIPPLDTFLGSLPDRPNCIYVHDVVIHPSGRGRNAAGEYIRRISEVALRHGIRSIALVSVYGTDVLWRRFGFSVVEDSNLRAKIASYGESAKYMVSKL